MSNNKIAPSILAADYANFASELKRIEETSAEYVHIDIMDGQFVPNITFGADVVASMRKHSKLVFDCHLMVVNPERFVDAFAQAGAVVINPGTPVSAIEPVLSLVDQVLIMTVNPGFGGQAFIPEMLEKVQKVAKIRDEKGYDFDIEVDGGVDNKTIKACYQAGANVFVAGSYLFKASDLTAQVETLRVALDD